MTELDPMVEYRVTRADVGPAIISKLQLGRSSNGQGANQH